MAQDLHPSDTETVFQHPISGCVHTWRGTQWECFVKNYGRGSDERDVKISVGQPAATRLELGDWLSQIHPDARLINQQFIDAISPCDFEGDSPESKLLVEHIDMTTSVMEAGGACTICGVHPDGQGAVDHRVGCEYISFVLYSMTKALASDGEPTLADVVREANEQIARMA